MVLFNIRGLVCGLKRYLRNAIPSRVNELNYSYTDIEEPGEFAGYFVQMYDSLGLSSREGCWKALGRDPGLQAGGSFPLDLTRRRGKRLTQVNISLEGPREMQSADPRHVEARRESLPLE